MDHIGATALVSFCNGIKTTAVKMKSGIPRMSSTFYSKYVPAILDNSKCVWPYDDWRDGDNLPNPCTLRCKPAPSVLRRLLRQVT